MFSAEELERLHFGAKRTHNYFEVVAGDDGISVLDPLDGGGWRPGDLALEDDVHGLVGVDVGRPLHELGRSCGKQIRETSQGTFQNENRTFIVNGKLYRIFITKTMHRFSQK